MLNPNIRFNNFKPTNLLVQYIAINDRQSFKIVYI